MRPSNEFTRIPVVLALAAAVFLSTECGFAATGADALLNATQPTLPSNGNPTDTAGSAPAYLNPSVMAMDEIKLSSPVARQVFAEWIATQSKSFEFNLWVKNFLKDQFEGTAHLWTAIQPNIPESFQHAARSMYLYSLYRLDLPQTFFNQWLSSLSQDSFLTSKSAQALEETVGSDFESWFQSKAILISSDQEATIRRVGPGRSALFAALNAVTYLRKGEAGAELLSKMPVNSPYRPLLAQTVAIALAKRQDLANAAKVLKTYYEPWLVRTKDPRKLALYYLQIGRLLYQAGALEAAASYYEKVPTGMPEFLTAREELSWCWLRMGEVEKLRGNLETLTSKAVENHFQPEAYLVRAIANLKFCYYAEVEKDFQAFLKVNARWAKEIEGNLARAEPYLPRRPDLFSVTAATRLESRNAEITQLKLLTDRSVGAVLPAVGPQNHWIQASNDLKRDLDSAKKHLAYEYQRQWKNDRQTLSEAIRKMQFVKVEMLSQVAAMKSMDQVQTTASSATQTPSGTKNPKITEAGTIVFPFDGVAWPDELFRLRSVAKGKCLGQ